MAVYLLTGSTGFLGRYIVEALQEGNRLVTIGRHFSCTVQADLAQTVPVVPAGTGVVVHAAGKAHMVPRTPAEEQAFFDVNLQGTKNLCAALEKSGSLPRAFVFISTVAVYGLDAAAGITEQHGLLGNTPYAKSKILAEAFLEEWCAKHQVLLSVLRLPLIAGANPPGNLGAMIAGIQKGRYFNIGKGDAQKSIVMAADVARFIPAIANTGGIYNLTDGEHPTFAGLAAAIAQQLGRPAPRSIPGWLAQAMALAGDLLGSKAPVNSSKLRKITATLTFNDQNARQAFGWKPAPVLSTFRVQQA